MIAAPVALYVHVPFCVSICPYCDFVVYAGRASRGPSSRVAPFVDALVAEIDLRTRPGSGLTSVYVGGGTPSLLSAGQVERILAAVDEAFGIAPGAEITIEANPGPDEHGDLAGFRAAGVTRLSIGAQSFDAGELRRLGRRHSPADIGDTVRLARAAGFRNISLDLLYDVPEQSAETWRASLTAATDLAVEHVSGYALTLDDPDAEGLTGTTGDHLPLSGGARRWRGRARSQQSEDRAAEQYEVAEEVLSRAGLEWYELSNWARPGRESRHNLAYWQGRPWEAVGPGAHAFDGIRTRRWNAARLDAYLAALVPADSELARLPPRGKTTAGVPTASAEAAILRLRTRSGLPRHMAAGHSAALAWAQANGITEIDAAGATRLTLRGRSIADELFARMLPEAESAAA